MDTREYIEKGGTARVTKGNTTIEVGGTGKPQSQDIIETENEETED